MAVPHLWLTAVLLLAPFCARCSSSEPVCPQPCSCDRAPVLNCSSSRLSSAPRLVKYSVTELDLSHNLLTSVTFHRPHHNLRRIWLGNNSITHLSLCLERQVGGRYLRHGLGTWSGRGCLTWAPTLQLLSIERNQLERLPEGLDGVEFLQILQLSFNRISILQPGELSHLRQLKELHLHHNLLTHLQPQIFQNLVQLRVLDLSFNMLTSLNPLMYLTLRNIGTDVRLDGNRWQCDCRMSGLQRWMAFDKSRGLRGWSVVCLSPSNLSGRDLQQLEEGDLTCSTTEDSPDRHQDVTVHRGSEILLSCSAQDSVWWTPSGQASGSQHQGGLLISDISEKDVGLYVCVSQEDDTVSVFNLQISEMAGAGKSNPSRTRRQIIPPHTSDKIVEERNQRATQSDLALAVCLSILFTFLIAFILGVLARPYVDALWKRMSKKKTDPAATVATVEQRQYDNMGFSSAEEAVETGPHRERRVTFSSADFGEDIHEPYYDIVASGDQAIVKGNAVIECETAEAKNDMHTAGNSGSENNLRQSSRVDMQIEDSDSDGITVRHNQEFERIPDRTELGERRSLSSSSDSSLSERVSKDKMAKGIHAMPKSPQLAEDTFQQRADSSAAKKVKVSKNSRKDKSQIPGFSSEPFADWSPHTSNRNPTNENSSQDNEELFEFSDSSQSISARSSSVFGSFNYPKEAIKPTSDKDKKGGISSSSSFSSSDNCKEPKQNKIKKEKGKGKERSTSNNGLLSSMVGAQGGTKKRVAPKPPTAKLSSSSTSGSKEENTDLNVGPHQKETSQTKGYLDVRTRTPSSDSLSSDESAENVRDNRTVHKKKNTRIHDSQEVSAHSSTLWPPLDLDRTTHVKRHLVIKAPSLRSDSSSSSDSENEKTLQEKKKEQVHTSKTPVEGSQTVGHKPENQWPAIDLGYVKRVKKRLDIKAPSASSDSSSSSDSEDDTSGHVGSQRRGILDIGLSLSDSKTQSQTPDGRWPALDLQHIPHVRRHLDFKAPAPSSDSSSSSDSEDEIFQKKDNETLHMSKALIKVSQTVSHKPENQWPAIDLGYVKCVKKRLDVKAPSASSDSSSSSDSEDDTTGNTGSQRPGILDIGLSLSDSKTQGQSPDGRWPALDLHHIPHVRRHLDFKAPRPASDSSSSSDSENETFQKKDNDRLNISITPVKVPQTVTQESKNQWPSSNLGKSTSIERDKDIKAFSPSSDSSSSSDDEGETTIQKKDNERLHLSRPPVIVSQTVSHKQENQRPVVALGYAKPIKQRLNINAPLASSDSSSTSESEDDTTGHTGGRRPGMLDIGLPLQGSKTKSEALDGRWPALDLHHIPHVRRHLDFKAMRPASDSSSSSDSENETFQKKDNERLHISIAPVKVPQTVIKEPENQWPYSNPGQSSSIKRNQESKAPAPSSDLSSSSDSEGETAIQKKYNERLHFSRPPVNVSQTVSHKQENQWPVVALGYAKPIKRRLNIKAPSASCDSSSTSESEDDTTGHTGGRRPGMLDIGLPLQGSKTKSEALDGRWPALDLHHIPHVRRHLDFKAMRPASDSSSSSDSENETFQKKDNERLHISIAPVKVPQTVIKEPENQWPYSNPGQSSSIKRNQEIKAPAPSSDSSSSSDSEGETAIQKKDNERLHLSRPPVNVSQTVSHKQENQWPVVALGYAKPIKRRLNIKAPSASSDSSSTNESEDDTTGHTGGRRPGMLDIGLPLQGSKTKSEALDGRWPALDLHHIPHVRRHLDFKAMRPASDSSSSSDSENETFQKKDNERLHISIAPVKVPQTVIKEPENQWPYSNPGQSSSIKRNQEIKAPAPSSDSSSSSDSEGETAIQKKYNERLNLSRAPVNVSQTVSHKQENQWPVVALGYAKPIKRRLNIKAPSASSDSSSTSESEDDTTGHTGGRRPGMLDIGPPLQGSQTKSEALDGRWPALDLHHIPHVRRHLDCKATRPASDSSSSSDSENEAFQKKDNETLHLSRPPFNVSQTVIHRQENQWPVIDLGYAKPIKRRLNIKAPSASSDSSSSSDSEGETTIQKKDNERLNLSRAPVTVSQTVIHKQENQWPVIDLGYAKPIKRRLNIKAPSASSDSSSSSDSEGETTIQKKDNERLNLSRAPVTVSQTVIHKQENQWPVIDLGYAKPIKRRLNIKAPSASSDSSSISESVKDTTGHTGSQRPGMLDIGLPLQESETKNQAADVRGLAVDLQHIVRIKRRLDIKAPTPSSHSSSSSDSEDETTIQKMGNQKLNLPLFNVGITGHSQEGKMGEVNKNPSYSSSSSDDEDPAMKHFNNQTATLETDPNSKWPKVGLSGNLHIKRRLDIKAHFHSPESSSSTEDDVKAEDLRVPKTDRNHVRIIPNVNRRLDIKAPLSQHNQAPSSMLDSQHSESHSSSSESEDEKRDSKAKVELGVTTMFAKRISQSQNQNQNVKLERYTILTDGNKPNADTPEINQDLQKKWADMKLGISRSRKRLEITSKAKEAPSLSSTQPDSPYSSSSDSGSGSRTRVKRRLAAMHEITHTDPTPILKNRPVNVSATSEKLDKYRSLVEIRDRVTDDYSFHGSGEKPKPDPILADFSPPYIGHTVTAPSTPSQKTYSSSSSSSENETVDQSVADLRAGLPRLKRRLNVKAPSPQLSSSQSSSSENENDEVAHNSEQSIPSSTHSGRRDDYPIPYKRSIIRAPLVPTNPLTPRGRDQHVAFTKESPMEVDLPLQVRWAGIGRHPSDILLPKPTNVNTGSTSLPQATPTAPKSSPLNPSDSLTITNIIQYSGSPSNKTNEMSESVPEDKKIKRGRGALKAMASERSVWESPLDKDASKGPQDGGSFEIYAKAKSAQPFKQLKLPSASADEKQTGYLLHGMPLYRRHNIRDINPPQEAPPPIPDTPPPDY